MADGKKAWAGQRVHAGSPLMFVSACNLLQHRADDETVKRQDHREIGPAEQIVRQHERGRGDAAALARGCDVDHDAKIQVLVVKAGNEAIRRLAQDRK